MLDVDVLYYLLQSSLKVDYYGLYDDLNRNAAFESLANIILTGPFNASFNDLKIKLIDKVQQLVFIGKDSTSPSIAEGLPYQHFGKRKKAIFFKEKSMTLNTSLDFVMPRTEASSDQIIRCVQAVQCQLSAFIYPYGSTQHIISKHPQRPLPSSLQRTLFENLKLAIQKHPANYFVIERLNAVPLMIESMEHYDTNIQNGIMDVLVYIMWDLNFVPLKELAVTSLHLQTTASGKVIALLCRRIQQLLQMSPKFLIVVRDTGLINVISLMLSNISDKLQKTAASETEDGQIQEPFVAQAIENFDTIVDCLVEMTKDPANAAVFRKA
ncbi:uncharacterized protein BYT42DRAFT_283491 [Radiomyces spectabilis]|uniref:uncharacterized protein n=1 Tax=Radiomyces spectabilis TaxID=64574 RepID=UPI00221E3A7E|nr:uncharacterized protein BYT42DRAFT_283491 [Radiomyces spectabilis]KAI8385017.1 hypothetical protein BYT42DRAFT_283491 [Radiomyces spectabilis]